MAEPSVRPAPGIEHAVGALVAWKWLPARDAQSGQDPVALTLSDPVDPELREPALV